MQRDDDVEIPSLTLDLDEVSDRRSSTPAAANNKAASKPTRPIITPATVSSKTNLVSVYILIGLVLVVFSGAGFWLWQQNVQLRNDLYGAKSEIQNLDHQLLAADVSANKQGETIEDTLRNHNSEIRKLWAVAYDRNRKTIADNSASISDLDKKLSTIRTDVSTQSKRIAVQAQAFNEVEAGFNKLIPSVAAIEKRVISLDVNQEVQNNKLTAAEQKILEQVSLLKAQSLKLEQSLSDLTTLQKEIRLLSGKVTTLENKETGLSEAELANIKQTLDRHQDAINSNDAFRSQVNTEIIRLRKQVNQAMLEQQLNSLN